MIQEDMQDACLHFNHLRSHEYVFSLSLAHGRTWNARDAVRTAYCAECRTSERPPCERRARGLRLASVVHSSNKHVVDRHCRPSVITLQRYAGTRVPGWLPYSQLAAAAADFHLACHCRVDRSLSILELLDDFPPIYLYV